jgi:hypothetical protein
MKKRESKIGLVPCENNHAIELNPPFLHYFVKMLIPFGAVYVYGITVQQIIR